MSAYRYMRQLAQLSQATAQGARIQTVNGMAWQLHLVRFDRADGCATAKVEFAQRDWGCSK